MGFFRPYERTEKDKDAKPRTLTPKAPAKGKGTDADKAPAEQSAPAEATAAPRAVKKSVPTPTRKAAEAARMERLHPTLTGKAARKKDREARRERQAETWDKVEKSPERAFLRNYVDARWTIVEFMLPSMLIFLAITMMMSYFPQYAMIVTAALWAFLLGCILNIVLLWRGFKRELAERYPKASTRSMLMYLINRAMMIRRFRQPRPAINRGAEY